MIQSFLLGLVLTCNYSFYSAPFASVRFTFDDNNKAANQATFIQYGKQQDFTLQQNAVVGDEKWNLTLAPNDPNNELSVKIFQAADGTYTSVLINESSPVGKEMQGVCPL